MQTLWAKYQEKRKGKGKRAVKWSREKERTLQKEQALACFSYPAARMQEQGERRDGLHVVT